MKRVLALLLLIPMLLVSSCSNTNPKNDKSFTVNSIDKGAKKYTLRLSEKSDFSSSETKLEADISKEMTNISENWLPKDLDKHDGDHSGDNYFAYTFYVKNESEKTVSYSYQLNIVDIAIPDFINTIRIRLYNNEDWINYARAASDGSGAEPGTTIFLNDKVVTNGTIEVFEPGEVAKFTVVIWIEGDDADCLDDYIGGEITISMDFVLETISL